MQTMNFCCNNVLHKFDVELKVHCFMRHGLKPVFPEKYPHPTYRADCIHLRLSYSTHLAPHVVLTAKMHVERNVPKTVFIVVLFSTLAVFSALGNLFVIAIIARFKKLRTYANILIANLSIVDLLNALINMPIYMLWGVLEASWFKGKALAILSSFFSRLFVLLNLASMLLLQVNLFLALSLDLRYFTWKTKQKAVVIVLVEWLICLALVSLSLIPLFDIDLQDAHVSIYREAIFLTYKPFLAAAVGVFIFCGLLCGVLTCCSVRRKKLQVCWSVLT